MGSSVISIGTRHVRVWTVEQVTSKSPSKMRPELETKSAASPDSPMPKIFAGRNCLLGALIDSTFSQSVTISECKAILCTVQGEVCLLDNTYKTQELNLVTKLDFSILCSTFDRRNDCVWFAGKAGVLQSISLSVLMNRAIPPDSHESLPFLKPSLPSNPGNRPDIKSVGAVRDQLVTIDSNHKTGLWTFEEDVSVSVIPSVGKTLPAHGAPVLGVRGLLPKARSDSPDFLTFSANGIVFFWMLDGSCRGSIDIAPDQAAVVNDVDRNEVKIVTPSFPDELLLVGDKWGCLR